jgi:hypothetical protein
MKKKVFSATSRGSKRVKGISREVRVIDLQTEFGIDSEALNTVMVLVSPHSHPYLFYKVCDCLRGFDAHMQNQIVEALAMYYSGEAYVLTCIEHVDELLVNLYHVFDLKLMNIKNK